MDISACKSCLCHVSLLVCGKTFQWILGLSVFSDCELLRPIPDCLLGYTIATHKALYQISHLLPENTVVGNNDVIPGISDTDTSGIFMAWCSN